MAGDASRRNHLQAALGGKDIEMLPVASGGGIGENDHKESGRLPAPIVSKSRRYADDVRGEPLRL